MEERRIPKRKEECSESKDGGSQKGKDNQQGNRIADRG